MDFNLWLQGLNYDLGHENSRGQKKFKNKCPVATQKTFTGFVLVFFFCFVLLWDPQSVHPVKDQPMSLFDTCPHFWIRARLPPSPDLRGSLQKMLKIFTLKTYPRKALFRPETPEVSDILYQGCVWLQWKFQLKWNRLYTSDFSSIVA